MFKIILKSIFSLISEDGLRCSLGRISFWGSFGVAMYIWIQRPPEQFPESLLWFLLFGYVYNTSKKLLYSVIPAFLARKVPGYSLPDEQDNLSESRKNFRKTYNEERFSANVPDPEDCEQRESK